MGSLISDDELEADRDVIDRQVTLGLSMARRSRDDPARKTFAEYLSEQVIGDALGIGVQFPIMHVDDDDVLSAYYPGDFVEISDYAGKNHTEAIAEGLSLLEHWRAAQKTSPTARETPVWLYNFLRDTLGLDDSAMQQMFVFGDKIIDGDGRTVRMRSPMGGRARSQQ